MGLRWLIWIGLSVLISAAAHALDLKIGVVDARTILDKAPQSELARQRLDEEFALRQQRLVEAQNALRGLEEQLAKGGDMMGEIERRELENKIRVQQRELKRSSDELFDDMNIRRNEELSKLQQQIIDTIVALAKEKGYDLILNHTAVVHRSERVDLTNDVLNRLAEQTKVPAR